MRFTKKLLAIALCIALLSVGAVPALADGDVPRPVNPTRSTVYINNELTAFEAYNIDGSNYFKLRDLAYVLNGTEKQFEIGYDNGTKAITLASGKAYTAVGGEMEQGDGMPKTAMPTVSRVFLDGEELELTAYIISGNNFLQLRELMRALNVGLAWDGLTSTIGVDTTQPYREPGNDGETARTVRYPQRGILYGYGDDAMAELQYSARYMFEQAAFPNIVRENETAVINWLATSNVAEMKALIVEIWGLAATMTILEDAEFHGEDVDLDNSGAIQAFVNGRRAAFGLGDEHIAGVTIEKIGNDKTVAIIELQDMGWSLVSSYIGIAYNQDMGLVCFTLERSFYSADDDDTIYMFCFVDVDSRGSIYPISNDRGSFISAIQNTTWQIDE